MTLSNVTLNDELIVRLTKVARTIQKMLDEVEGSAFFLKEKAYLTTRIQAASSVNMQNNVDRLLFNVIIDHCVKAEKYGPGAFKHTLQLILQQLLFPESRIPDIKNISKYSYRPTWTELNDVLSHQISDAFLEKIVFESLELAGLEGRIFVDHSYNDITSVEKVNGYNFNVKLPIQVSETHNYAKVVVIDGMIETVSEVHHLLQKFSETKETLILVVRNLSDDVIHTLKVNKSKKTLNVIPVIVKYDFDGLNVLNDIALVCETDVISSMKGQLISAIPYDTLKNVSCVSFKDEIMTIVNNNVIARTELQIRQLIEKSKNAEHEQFRRIYDDRIRSLTPSSVRIRFTDQSFTNLVENVDVSLRIVRSSLRHGLFSRSRMRKGSKEFPCFPHPLPLETVAASILYAEKCVKTLSQIHSVIIT